MNELFIQLFGGLDLPEKIMNLEAQIQYIIDTDSKSSDYQQFLENNWVDELKTEFTIKINTEVFSKVKNQLKNQMKYCFQILILLLMVTSCDYFKAPRKPKAIARVGENYLFEADILDLVPKGTSKQDSIAIVKSFIGQ